MPVAAVQRFWDILFGPPRVRRLPDGSVRVRLLGRVHEAADYGALFDSVSREREQLINAVTKTREGVLPRAELSMSRIGPGEWYHRDVQRLEDRLAIYNDFLGHLARVMGPS